MRTKSQLGWLNLRLLPILPQPVTAKPWCDDTLIDSFDVWDVTIHTPQRGVGEVRAVLVSEGRSFKVKNGAEN